MRLRILTKEVLTGIPVLVQQGMDADAIAARLGCKVSTLKVRCSQAQISLRVPQEVRVPLVPWQPPAAQKRCFAFAVLTTRQLSSAMSRCQRAEAIGGRSRACHEAACVIAQDDLLMRPIRQRCGVNTGEK